VDVKNLFSLYLNGDKAPKFCSLKAANEALVQLGYIKQIIGTAFLVALRAAQLCSKIIQKQ
jgi:hypothetical protein